MIILTFVKNYHFYDYKSNIVNIVNIVKISILYIGLYKLY